MTRRRKDISLEQVRIFSKYGGDADGFSRSATALERKVMRDDVWPRIDVLVQSLALIERNLAAREFVQETVDLLRNSVATPEVEGAIRQLVPRTVGPH